jgi:hypothetical protein
MQFGDNKKPSEVIQLISYDNDINQRLNSNYNNGEIKAISTICYETTGKRGLLYRLEKIDYFGGVGQVGAVSIHLPDNLLIKLKKEEEINKLVANLLQSHYRESIKDE